MGSMSNLIIHLLSLGLRGAISPMTMAICLALLNTAKPLRNAISFVLGYTSLHVVLGLLAFLISGLTGNAKIPLSIEAYIRIGLGALLILFGVVAWFRARGSDDPPPKWAEVLDSITPFRAFFLGTVAWINNLSHLVFYLAGLHTLVSASLSLVGNVVLLTLFILLIDIELLVPIGLYAMVPHRANEVLQAIREWLMEHNRALSAAIFGGFGVWLLLRGALALVG